MQDKTEKTTRFDASQQEAKFHTGLPRDSHATHICTDTTAQQLQPHNPAAYADPLVHLVCALRYLTTKQVHSSLPHAVVILYYVVQTC